MRSKESDGGAPSYFGVCGVIGDWRRLGVAFGDATAVIEDARDPDAHGRTSRMRDPFAFRARTIVGGRPACHVDDNVTWFLMQYAPEHDHRGTFLA